jgi:hypothetical protein
LDQLTQRGVLLPGHGHPNEAVRLGFADAHIHALNRVPTGVDIWILLRSSW